MFNGNISSLHELRLAGVITDLPWRNLSNLTMFDFRRVSGNDISTTQLLDFFEHAPLIHEIRLKNSLPNSSNAAAERVVSLPHLRSLRIFAQPAHSILLNHLCIPIGASVTLEFTFSGDRSPIPDYLPRSLDNLSNISHITSIKVDFDSGVAMRLKGPNRDLHVLGFRIDAGFLPIPTFDQRILRSLNELPISTTEILEIGQYDNSTHPEAYRTLLLMNDLLTLRLDDYINPSFISALNPNRNTSNTVVCPKLEELILCIQAQWDEPCIDELLEMVEERASMGAKLSVMVIVCPRILIPAEEERVSACFTRGV